jgi:hypothetical protein
MRGRKRKGKRKKEEGRRRKDEGVGRATEVVAKAPTFPHIGIILGGRQGAEEFCVNPWKRPGLPAPGMSYAAILAVLTRRNIDEFTDSW